MRHGKMKTLHGLYKTLGRDLFLELAKNYSNNVHGTIDATLWEMESRWYDKEHTITEAEKMVADYNKGVLVGYDCEVVPAVQNTMKMEALA
jgi:hypothetical protein